VVGLFPFLFALRCRAVAVVTMTAADVKEIVVDFLNARTDRIVHGEFNEVYVTQWLGTALRHITEQFSTKNRHVSSDEQNITRFLRMIPQFKRNLMAIENALSVLKMDAKNRWNVAVEWGEWNGDDMESKNITLSDSGESLSVLNKVVVRRSNMAPARYEMKFF
jgi:hypothetical protein